MFTIVAEFQSGHTMVGQFETDLEALDALADLTEELDDEPVCCTKDDEPWGWEPLDAEEPHGTTPGTPGFRGNC